MIGKIQYLDALGINVLQPLPIDELETDPSMGYNGADYFSPDMPVRRHRCRRARRIPGHHQSLARSQRHRAATLDDITSGPAQLKAMVDLCHLYGIAVTFDVVYNHAGGFIWRRPKPLLFGSRRDDSDG